MNTDGRDGGGDERPGRSPPDDDAALQRRLRDLQGKLQERRTAEEAAAPKQRGSGAGGMAQALRLGSEFVAGVLVGAAIGWAVDRLFDISPWGLIVFLLLGFAAGVLNVLRSTGLVKTPDLPPADGSAG
jgi:ATP synthase protein I